MFRNRVPAGDDGRDDSLEAPKFEIGSKQGFANELKAQKKEAISEGFPTNEKNLLLQSLMKRMPFF